MNQEKHVMTRSAWFKPWANVQADKLPDAQHVRLYHLYRVCASGTILGSQAWPYLTQRSTLPDGVFWAMVVFFLYAAVFAVYQQRQPVMHGLLLKVQTVFDIVLTTLVMYLLPESQSSIGLLLIINIMFASLISDGLFAIFYAALATIGVLLENTFQLMAHVSQDVDYANSALLSICCFAAAWLAHTLAMRMQSSEELATQRGLDIAQLAKINALITREMPSGVLVIDQHQAIKHYNAQASHLLGLDTDMLDHAINEHIPIEQLIPPLVHLLVSRESRLPAQHDALRLNMNHRELGIRFHAISEDIENGVVIFIEDWSHLQTQAQQVKLAALGRLTANIAHEIRNPLSAISHATQLLQEDTSEPGTLRLLQIVSDNVQRLDQIIKDVLELNRRDRTNQEVFSINTFVQEFYQQFCAVEKIDLQHFTLKLLKHDSPVLFDRRHINQILWNLCKNGWRHGQHQANSLRLTLTKDKSGQFIQVLVIDDGPGMDPKLKPHMFEPFMTTENNGTGLGLFIARELAEANGAKLDYTRPASGTQFSLTIKKAKV